MGIIIRSGLMVVAIAAVVGGATTAYFNDTETSTGNLFTAGTLDLKVDNENPLVSKFIIADVKPGDKGGYSVAVENVGSISGDLAVSFKNLVDNENTCTEPELNDPDPAKRDITCNDDQGEMSANMQVKVFALGADPLTAAPLYSGTLANLVATSPATPVSLGSLAAAGISTFYIYAELPTTVGNVIQSDSAQFDIELVLTQN